MKKRNVRLSKSASKRPTWIVSSNVSSERRIFVLRTRGHSTGNARRRNDRKKTRRPSKSKLLKMQSVRQRRPSVRKRMRKRSWLSSRKERQRPLKLWLMAKVIMLLMLASSKKHHPARSHLSKIIRSRKEKAREKSKRVKGRASLPKRHLLTLELQRMANKMLKAITRASETRKTENRRRMRNNSKKSPLVPVHRRSTKSSKRRTLQTISSSSLQLKTPQHYSKSPKWTQPNPTTISNMRRGSPRDKIRNLRMPLPHRLSVALSQRHG